MLLAVLVAAVVVVVVTLPGGGAQHRAPAHKTQAAIPNGPQSWTVHPGDTFEAIAAKTGLTVTQLEALNPKVDPNAIQPGEHLYLRPPPPPPPPKPPGPRFWTVRSGQSFGYIAAKTGIAIQTLLQLNPKLKPTTLQPGDQVRLRR